MLFLNYSKKQDSDLVYSKNSPKNYFSIFKMTGPAGLSFDFCYICKLPHSAKVVKCVCVIVSVLSKWVRHATTQSLS